MITLENVSWAYARAEQWALVNISLAIGEGEFITVMGENGAGKTTLCRLLNGLIPHSLPGKLLGKVTIDGMVTADSTVAQLAGKVGMAFEDPDTQLFTATAGDEVAFALENLLFNPDEIREKVQWAVDKVGLSAYMDYAPSMLSGGQKQRLVIAAALAMASKVLVLDDPCSQLDPAGAHEVLTLVNELRSGRGLSVVMASYTPEETAGFADKICVLKNGSIAAFDTPRRIFADQRLLSEWGIQPPHQPRFPAAAATDVPLHNTGIAIQAAHLHFGYTPGKPILNDINLRIGENEFVVIAGHNGSGKTTLLKNICGLLRPSQGTITLRGKDTAKMGITEIAGDIGFVMQDPDRQLFEQTVFDEVALGIKGSGAGLRERVEEALHTVGLGDKRDDFPPALGRADRVKVVFAAVLAMGPKIIMLDEPIAGQDARGCALIMDILAKLHRQGYTIMVVTHNMPIATEYAQRLIVMKNGRIAPD